MLFVIYMCSFELLATMFVFMVFEDGNIRCNVAMYRYSGLGRVRAVYVQYVSQWFWESVKTSQQSFEEQRVYRASYIGWPGVYRARNL